MTGAKASSLVMSAIARKKMTNFNFQPKGYSSEQGWYFRNLPHFEAGERPQFLTARLFDSLPRKILDNWRKKLEKDKDDVTFRKKIEHYLNVIKYIENNPVKAGLCNEKEKWKYSSAYFRANGIEF